MNGLATAPIGDYQRLKRLIADLDLTAVSFDSCMLGLKSVIDSKPIRKPMKILTNGSEITKQFGSLKCNGHAGHRPCAGVDTKVN